MLTRYIYFVLFAISGFSGLIYESIWTHYLKLFLGHAAYAQTLVLVIFMGGMAIGAWIAGQRSAAIHNVLLGYALVEGVIGLLAIIFHNVFIAAMEMAYTTVIPNLSSPVWIDWFKWTLATLLILPQSILLGMTFPLMSVGIIRRFPEAPGYSLAILYFTNSLGAAIGVLVSGFVLLKVVGLPGTILTAGIINIVLALIVWLLCHQDTPQREIAASLENRYRQPSQALLIALLWCSAITGAASFLYEIAWIRMLSLVLGSSNHAFELMLSAFILGLALGGFWIKKRIDLLPNVLRTVGFIQVLMGLFALSTLLFYGHTFEWMVFIMEALTKTEEGYVLFNLLSHGLVMFIMLPTTICAGMTLPLFTYQLLREGHGEKAVGGIYAANTLGAIVGIIIGVQCLMPLFGVKHLITVGGWLDIALGLGLLWYALGKLGRIGWGLVATVASVCFLAVVIRVDLDPVKMSSGVFRYGALPEQRTVIFHRDGKTASIDVFKRADDFATLSTNGKPDATIGNQKILSPDELTMVLLSALPWSLYPEAKTAAVVGFGSGLSTHVLLTVPSLQSVDTIEIEPSVIEGARHFGSRVENAFHDPRGHIHIEDAKTYFTTHQKTYDIIVSEPSNPWVSGVAGLFSTEFYTLVSNYISDEGLFVQWLQVYELDTALVASVIKALSPHFADYAIYVPVEGDLIIVAKKKGQLGQPSNKLFTIPAMVKELERIHVLTPQDLNVRRIGNKSLLDPFFFSYPIPENSDYFPVLMLEATRTRYLRLKATEIMDLKSSLPVIPILEDAVPTVDTASQISQNDYLALAIATRQAMAIFQYFQKIQQPSSPAEMPLSLEALQLINNLRLMDTQCGSDETVKIEFASLQKLAHLILPYLPPTELSVIWQELENASCFTKLPDSIRQWFHLYKAIGNRDFEQMIKLSTALLPTQKIESSQNNDYLLTVALLAHLKQNEPRAALALWARYENRQNPSTYLRLLSVMIANKL